MKRDEEDDDDNDTLSINSLLFTFNEPPISVMG